MAIFRLHFEDGFTLPLTPDISKKVDEVVLAHADQLELLAEGDYPLTPKSWKNPTLDHSITVFDTGAGLYRSIPNEKGTRIADLTRRTARATGQTVHMPRDRETVAITTPNILLSAVNIFEVLLHSPGPSPRR